MKAIIGPHAGLEYAGQVQASAYVNIENPEQYSTVFLIGPSHHTPLDSCALVTATHYETPFGDLEVDQEII